MMLKKWQNYASQQKNGRDEAFCLFAQNALRWADNGSPQSYPTYPEVNVDKTENDARIEAFQNSQWLNGDKVSAKLMEEFKNDFAKFAEERKQTTSQSSNPVPYNSTWYRAERVTTRVSDYKWYKYTGLTKAQTGLLIFADFIFPLTGAVNLYRYLSAKISGNSFEPLLASEELLPSDPRHFSHHPDYDPSVGYFGLLKNMGKYSSVGKGYKNAMKKEDKQEISTNLKQESAEGRQSQSIDNVPSNKTDYKYSKNSARIKLNNNQYGNEGGIELPLINSSDVTVTALTK